MSLTAIDVESNSNNSLVEQSLSRKQKLNELKKRKLNVNTLPTEGAEANQPDSNSKRTKKEFKFRNYDPVIQGPKRHDPTENSKETVEESVKDLIEKVKQKDEVVRSSELDLTKIQPKKLNWDLKRDLMKKLSKLESETQAAFASLIRKRMQAEGATSTEEGTAALVKEMNTNRIVAGDESDGDSSDV